MSSVIPPAQRPSVPGSLGNHEARIRALERTRVSRSRVIDDAVVDLGATVATIDMPGIPQDRDYLEGTWTAAPYVVGSDPAGLVVVWFNGNEDFDQLSYFSQLNRIDKDENNTGFADFANFADCDPFTPFILLGYTSTHSQLVGTTDIGSPGAMAVGTFKIPRYAAPAIEGDSSYGGKELFGFANTGPGGGNGTDDWVAIGSYWGARPGGGDYRADPVIQLTFGIIAASWVDDSIVIPLAFGPGSRFTLCGDPSTPRTVS
jgi:hypothetical protein